MGPLHHCIGPRDTPRRTIATHSDCKKRVKLSRGTKYVVCANETFAAS